MYKYIIQRGCSGNMVSTIETIHIYLPNRALIGLFPERRASPTRNFSVSTTTDITTRCQSCFFFTCRFWLKLNKIAKFLYVKRRFFFFFSTFHCCIFFFFFFLLVFFKLQFLNMFKWSTKVVTLKFMLYVDGRQQPIWIKAPVKWQSKSKFS